MRAAHLVRGLLQRRIIGVRLQNRFKFRIAEVTLLAQTVDQSVNFICGHEIPPFFIQCRSLRLRLFQRAHRKDRVGNEVVERPAQHICTALNDLTGTARGKVERLYFFFTDLSSKSSVLFDGRISATAPMSPVSSSTAYSTFSISCSGAMSTVSK